MSVSREDINEIIEDYELGYSKSSIEKSLTCIFNLWGRKFIDSVPRETRWYLTELIDTGLMINELKGIDGSDTLFDRLYRKERAAFSEARLATFFSKLGFDVELEPESENGHYNDLSVNYNGVWVNIEVKTPEESELAHELHRNVQELLEIHTKIRGSREIYICLAQPPDPDDIPAICSYIIDNASKPNQPTYGLINDNVWVKTDHLSSKMVKTERRWFGSIPMPVVPAIFQNIFDSTISFLYAIVGFRDEDEITISVNVPFEDSRLFSFLRKKSKQLSKDRRNIVAIDTSRITLSYPSIRERVINLPKNELEREWSRRIGSILFFKRTLENDKLNIESSLLIHPNPHKPIPSQLLKKCSLNIYSELMDND